MTWGWSFAATHKLFRVLQGIPVVFSIRGDLKLCEWFASHNTLQFVKNILSSGLQELKLMFLFCFCHRCDGEDERFELYVGDRGITIPV